MDAVRLSLQDQSRHSALLERLSDLLLDGVSQEAAALRVVDEGATQGDVESAIRAILVHPLFKKAREGRVRLECRDWLLDAYASLQELRHAPERIDTATLQVLYAFVRDRLAGDREVTWQGVPAALTDAARLLGVRDLLCLPAAS